MRNPSIPIIFFLTLLSATTVDASSLYTVPIEVPAETEKIQWPDHVQGVGGDLFAEAVGHHKRGNYSEALSRFKGLMERYERSEAAAAANLYIGSIYFKMAMKAEKKDGRLLLSALESFQKSVRNSQDPKNLPILILEIGKTYREMNLMEESKGSFKRVIKEYPSTRYTADARYQLALTYEKEGDYKGAMMEYQILSLNDPRGMGEERTFGMGRTLFALHEFGEAKRYYDEGLRRWTAYVKGHPEILFNYSECQFQNGEFSKAREGFLTLYNLYPESRDAAFALNRVGAIHVLERENAIAENIYRQVLALFPKGEDAFVSKLALGDIKFISASGNTPYQDALTYYEEVEKYAVDKPYGLKARYKIAKVLEAQGKYKKSLNIYNELLDKTDGPLNKEISTAFYNLTGKIVKEIEEKLSHNDYLGVVKTYQVYYKDFIDRMRDEELLMKIAEVHGRLLLYNEATYLYQKIIAKNGVEKGLALFKSGELYSYMGDDKSVVETLDRYIADYPQGEKGDSARVIVAESLYNLKDYEKAANHLYAVIRNAPYRYPSAYLRLSDTLSRSGQYQDSANILRDMIKHLSQEKDEGLISQAYIALGNAFYGLGRYEEALDAYRHGLNHKRIEEGSEMVQFMVGDCLLRLNKKDDAKRVFSDLSERSAGLIKHFSEERIKDIAFNPSL